MSKKIATLRRAGFAAGAAAVACFLALLPLPGRSSEATSANLEDASAKPGIDGFDVGNVHWDVATYRSDPKLQPFRDFVDGHCAGLVGTSAGWCIASEFRRAFPHGAPKVEFVAASYDPAADLASHLAGEAGHCVTRSGLLATALLASGIPARVAQFLPAGDVPGHTVAEVWDPAVGWAMVDSSLYVEFISDQGPASVADILYGTKGTLWTDPATSSDAPGLYATWRETRIKQIVYPEPWLYTRSGHRAASFPFRSRAVHVGPSIFLQGPAQTWLRRSSVGFLALAAALLVMSARRRRALHVGPLDVGAPEMSSAE